MQYYKKKNLFSTYYFHLQIKSNYTDKRKMLHNKKLRFLIKNLDFSKKITGNLHSIRTGAITLNICFLTEP
jgi:hypothetical protein